MKILKLRADGFGPLRADYVFDPDRLTLVIDENERGKSSLLHAVAAALYGLDADGRRFRGLLTPLERWRPWDEGNYRIEVELDAGGERYTVQRDFARGTVEVWNGRGQEVTAEFFAGKDDYPVGQRFFGLDVEEFAKCAFLRQGELEQVVPDQEKDRRVSTLHARLEKAADTRSGDSSAIEAIAALDRAAAKFFSPELGTAIRVENVIGRLEALRQTLEADVHALEHDYRAIAGPLESLARLGDDERAVRARLHDCDAERLARRADEARRRLERDEARHAEIDQLRTEASTLAAYATVPPDAADAVRTYAAHHDAVRRTLEEQMERCRVAEQEHITLAESLADYADISAATPEDADRLTARAGELRRLASQESRLRRELAAAHEALRAEGIDPTRVDDILARFERATPDHQELLRDQPRFSLAHQVELATLEQTRAVGRDALRDLAAWRRQRFVIGAAAIVIGGVVAGGAFALPDATMRLATAAAGAVVAAFGIATVTIAALARRGSLMAARDRLAHVEEHHRQLMRRAEQNETRLRAVASAMKFESVQALLAEWTNYQRLRELHGPVRSARFQLADIDQQRESVIVEISPVLEAVGVHTFTPETLEQAAARLRERRAVESRVAEAERNFLRQQGEARGTELKAREHEALAAQAIDASGLRYDRAGSWSSWIDAVQARVRNANRYRQLVEHDLPSAERERLDDAAVAAAQAEIAAAEATPKAQDPRPDGPSPVELERESAELHARLDELAREREELRLVVEGTSQLYHAEHPDKLARLEAVQRELERAERFRDASTLARETIEKVALATHRRWAEFLNDRVSELLTSMGTRVGKVRFGEDLDFAVKLPGGRQIARGKAVHQLSSGARDQLHLAVRLAISEYLSKGGVPLPLLIDDCFATSDDERTRAGMRMLLESLSRKHQIVLVTCHRRRYQDLAALDPDLYAERVQWLDLQSPVAAIEA